MKPEIKTMVDKYPCAQLSGGIIRTCPVRLSYPKLWEPDKYDEASKPAYSASLLFPAGADLGLLKAAAVRTVAEKFPGTPPNNLRSPFRDQTERAVAGDRGYIAGSVYLNVSCPAEFHKPQIVDARMMPITDRSRVYPGVWALVTLNAYAYDKKGNKGVAFGLQNVQIIADDEQLAGTPAAASQFGAIEAPGSFSAPFALSA